jgi:hypothetical protein
MVIAIILYPTTTYRTRKRTHRAGARSIFGKSEEIFSEHSGDYFRPVSNAIVAGIEEIGL